MQSFLWFASCHRNHIKNFAHITSGLYKLCSKDVLFEITKEGRDEYERINYELTNAPVLILALEKLHYYLEGAVFELYTDCTALKSLLNMKTTNRHMLRWQIAIREYRCNMNIIYKEGKSHTNADGLRRLPLDNIKRNPTYDLELPAKIPIHSMEIDRRKNFRFS
ncbi:hypothetical protein O181_012675 [Austropuccinia psidii MF-1]|uniref:Reverse transcriptase RNase H-like domain-containing protein n=1 Tax=Austropuccinia psidii MF-1 TaxID=1389203 RepID=A0A9Q3GN64_9BASI|nr:hypothetical protein [Austropuccinia psidii MF-1]